jgi:hypothetical protein
MDADRLKKMETKEPSGCTSPRSRDWGIFDGGNKAPHNRKSARCHNCASKAVVDCFKHRNKIGLDVALEALRDCIRRRRATADELWRYAEVDRVQNVMRPYLEATQ